MEPQDTPGYHGEGDEASDRLEVYGLLESDDPAVVSWAESLYEDYLADAEPLQPGMLATE